MLGVRCVFAVILAIPLIVTFFVALGACRVDSTLLDAEYLRGRIHEADVYALAYDELTREWV